MTVQRMLRRHRLISYHHTSKYIMSKFFVYSMTFVVIVQATKMENTIDGSRGSDRIRVVEKSILDSNNDISHVYFTNLFGGHSSNTIDSKPDFITNFDVFKLMKKEYAMKEFYCVINEAPCDGVGERLKASIAEALNRDFERCTSTETINIQRIINYVKKHYAQCWIRIEDLYKVEDNDQNND